MKSKNIKIIRSLGRVLGFAKNLQTLQYYNKVVFKFVWIVSNFICSRNEQADKLEASETMLTFPAIMYSIIFPTQATELFNKAVELEQSGCLYEAIQFYRRAMTLVPDIEFRAHRHNMLERPEGMSAFYLFIPFLSSFSSSFLFFLFHILTN